MYINIEVPMDIKKKIPWTTSLIPHGFMFANECQPGMALSFFEMC